ncbi:hypothetical protein [Caudoviricetes sp.]|nr:hypothetical protein [Caudoviricetes sp.]
MGSQGNGGCRLKALGTDLTAQLTCLFYFG